MLKPASLRAELTAAIVDAAGVKIFERDPVNLKVWGDKGRIAGRLGPARSFEYRYRLNVFVQDFAGDEDAIVIVINDWVSRFQPELLLNHEKGDQAITFEVDVLDNDLVDMLFELDVTETVRVLPRDGGGFEATHEAEPAIDALLLGEAFEGAPARPLLAQVYAGGNLIVDGAG